MADPVDSPLAAPRIRLFGPVTVLTDRGASVPIGGARQRSVLAALALRVGRPVSVSTLVETVWEAEPPRSVENALQVYVSGLRRALAPLAANIVREGTTYRLLCDPRDVDCVVFSGTAATARSALRAGEVGRSRDLFERAMSLHVGEPLAGLDTGPLAQHREQLNRELRATRQDQVIALYSTGSAEQAVDVAARLVAEDRLDEINWSRYMSALYFAGRSAEALDAFRRARRTIRDELGLEPSTMLREVERGILDNTLSMPAVPPAPQPVSVATEASALIGRDELLTETTTAILTERLVTLSGLGGVGKSAVAAEIRKKLLRAGASIISIDAIGVEDVDGLSDLIAETAKAEAADPSSLRAALASRVLLVDHLDHLDHDAVRVLFGQLLTGDEEVHILLGARRPLGLRSETNRPVGPLSNADSTDLFIRAARQVRPDFDAARWRSEISELCRLAGGLPLAIDLTARQIRTSSPDRLLGLFTGTGGRALDLRAPIDAPERQRTMRTVLQWSISCCSAPAQELLQLLAAGGGEMHLTVLDEYGPEAEHLLEELVLAGLVEGPDEYGRVFAAPLVCAAVGSSASARERLVDIFAAALAPVALRADPILPTSRLAQIPRAVDRAVRAAVDQDRARDAAYLFAALGGFWSATAGHAEAMELIDDALNLPSCRGQGPPSVDRGALLLSKASLAAALGSADVPTLLRDGLALVADSEWDPSYLMVGALCDVGAWYRYQDDEEHAVALADEALQVAGEREYLRPLAVRFRSYLAAAFDDDATAVRLGMEVIERQRRRGDNVELVLAMTALVQPLIALGRLEQARTLADESYERAQGAMSGQSLAQVINNVAFVALAVGQPASAIGHATEVLRTSNRDRPWALIEVAALLILQGSHTELGDMASAAVFRGAVAARLTALGLADDTGADSIRPQYDRLLATPGLDAWIAIGQDDPTGLIDRWLTRGRAY